MTELVLLMLKDANLNELRERAAYWFSIALRTTPRDERFFCVRTRSPWPFHTRY